MVDVVLERRVRAGQPVGDDELSRRLDHLLLDGRRHRHDLAGGARLVDVLERVVGERVGAGLADVGRVVGGVGRDGPQLAGLDLLHDDVAGQRLALRNHVGDLVLRVPLQVGVDGQPDVGAVHGRLVDLVGAGDGRPVLGALVDHLAGLALQGAVRHDLDAAAGRAVLLDEPDQGRRAHPRGVDTAGRGFAVDAGDTERADLAPGDRGDVLGDDAVLGTHQLRYQCLRRGAEKTARAAARHRRRRRWSSCRRSGGSRWAAPSGRRRSSFVRRWRPGRRRCGRGSGRATPAGPRSATRLSNAASCTDAASNAWTRSSCAAKTVKTNTAATSMKRTRRCGFATSRPWRRRPGRAAGRRGATGVRGRCPLGGFAVVMRSPVPSRGRGGGRGRWSPGVPWSRRDPVREREAPAAGRPVWSRC